MKHLKTLGFVLGSVLFAGTALASSSVEIPQVPANAEPADNDESMIKANNNNDSSDYQNQILNDPNMSERARAEAAINSSNRAAEMEGVTGGDVEAARGNHAVIIQKGKANNSSITQKGDNNYASQTQDGNHNDLRVEQNGKNNVSEEHQKGDYNHKIKIQNGEKSEETTTDQ